VRTPSRIRVDPHRGTRVALRHGMRSRSRIAARSLRISCIALLVPVLAAAAALVTKKSAHAEDATADKAEQNERCSVRLSMALLGESPEESLLASNDPQSAVDEMVSRPEFTERFARFINSELSGMPSEAPGNDPVYFLAHHVLTQNKPWSDLFKGPYSLTPTENGVTVGEDPEGLGYFRSTVWRKKFAGNDEGGAMLVAAFRIIQNTTGLELNASVGNADEDRSLEGRKAPACRGCHYDSWFALDLTAQLLPKREGTGDAMKFIPPTAGPQKILGKTIANDKELVETLVASEAWTFNQCRRVFKFLYGRTENQCEAKVFDACVDALNETQDIKKAVATVAKDPSFCSN
jgi:hypothetical protein